MRRAVSLPRTGRLRRSLAPANLAPTNLAREEWADETAFCDAGEQEVVDARCGGGRAVHDHARQHRGERGAAVDAPFARICLCPSSSGSSPAMRSRLPRSCSPAASSPTCSAGAGSSWRASSSSPAPRWRAGWRPSGGFLIGARVVQGLGGALINPATLSIIAATFPPRERGKAIGIWAGVSAMALAIGPLVGGLLTEHVNWNWIFFINVPIGIAGLIAIPFLIDESRDTSREQRPDVPGLVTSAVGLFALTYAFIEANSYGWTSTRILGSFVVAARRDRRVRGARAPAAPADARPLALPQPHVQRRQHGDALRRPRDVRDVLLRLALHAERARLLAGAGGCVVPAA